MPCCRCDDVSFLHGRHPQWSTLFDRLRLLVAMWMKMWTSTMRNAAQRGSTTRKIKPVSIATIDGTDDAEPKIAFFSSTGVTWLRMNNFTTLGQDSVNERTRFLFCQSVARMNNGVEFYRAFFFLFSLCNTICLCTNESIIVTSCVLRVA